MLESSAYELGESDNAIKQQLGELKQAADQLEGNQVKIKQELTSDFENLKDQTILQQNDIYDYIETKINSIPKELFKSGVFAWVNNSQFNLVNKKYFYPKNY